MIVRPRVPGRRSGAAAVEFALVLAMVLMPLLTGLWEVGRLVQVQQIVSNSAREGARLAAQALTINTSGSPTQIVTSIPPPNAAATPNVKAAVVQSLRGAGLNNLTWSDVTVTFVFVDSPAGSIPGATEPYQGVKNQRFRVSVSIPFEKVRVVSLGIVNPTTVSFEVEWRMLVDDPFTINVNLPGYTPN
jgi:Flp pilus assembly protein TadG